MPTTKKKTPAKPAKRAGKSASAATRKTVARSSGKAAARTAAKGAARAGAKTTGRGSASAKGASSRKGAARATAKSTGRTTEKVRAAGRTATAKRTAASAKSSTKAGRPAARKTAPAKKSTRAAASTAGKPKSAGNTAKTQKVTKIPTNRKTGERVAATPSRKAAVPAKAQKAATKPAAREAAAVKPKLKVVPRSAGAPSPGAPSAAAASAKAAAAKTPATKPPAAPANDAQKHNFQVGDHVVYPSHGVGKIIGIESHTIGEQKLQMFVISFEKERMTLRVPVAKISTAGMRRLSSQAKMDAAVTALKGRARARRVMWSRRAQEYEAKLNSGDPVSIAEVVRDLHRNVGQPDQSYSERQMYEAALERLAREFAAVEKIDTEQAAEKLEKVLRAA